MRTLRLPGFSKLLKPLAVVTALTLLGATPASAWWNDQWTARKKVTLDATAISEPIGTTPVLVRLFDGNFPFAQAAGDGSDLRFVAEDDKTPLAFQIEKFDPVLNEAFVWVSVPDVKPGAKTTFWVYYGNAGKLAAVDAKGTFDRDTVLVYHFGEHGSPAADATGTGNNAQTAGRAVDGSMIGTGVQFDGHGTLNIGGADSLAWTEGGAMTWSAWIKFASPQPNAVIFSRWDGNRSFVVGADKNVPFVEVSAADGTIRRSSAGAALPANSWHHLAAVAAGSTITLYVDGVVYGSIAAPLPALKGLLFVGGDGPFGATDVGANRTDFLGEMDELALAKVARPAGFVKLAALAQGGGASLLTFGEEEQPTSWMSALKGGYVGVILSSLSIDGWVVIGLLGVMLVVSWAVMIGKANYLNRVSRGNAQFLKEWSRVATDLSVLDSDDAEVAKSLGGQIDAAAHRAMKSSPLYRIYHIGAEEIRLRVSASRGGSKVISARSIQAIRASLDGGLVRETQRLNSQMVLLTIAISGGPFLGLLGTVVGVMITFAAVAQAGDVNVNAIAPGIAAALAATVAGLGVAIPALFGYNYLLTRVKSASSDMHVFIDEFVTKMAEFYSETADASRTLTRAPFAPSEPTPPKK